MKKLAILSIGAVLALGSVSAMADGVTKLDLTIDGNVDQTQQHQPAKLVITDLKQTTQTLKFDTDNFKAFIVGDYSNIFAGTAAHTQMVKKDSTVLTPADDELIYFSVTNLYEQANPGYHSFNCVWDTRANKVEGMSAKDVDCQAHVTVTTTHNIDNDTDFESLHVQGNK